MLFKKVKEEADNQFEVYGICNFAEEYLRLYHEEYYNEFQEDCDYDKMMDNYLKTCQENKTNNKMMFDTILVDEGQDFRESWFKSLYNFLNDDGSLYVFYDKLQMLYEKFGHTHEPFKEEKNGMLLMNPGSIAKPVLKDRCIGFIEIDDDGNLIRSELKLVKLYE